MSNNIVNCLRSKLWLVPGLLACACFYSAYAASDSNQPQPVDAVAAASSDASPATLRRVLKTTPIQDIEVGMRVLAHNPQATEADRAAPEPDPETWRKIKLHMIKADGSDLAITLLRPLAWLQEIEAELGQVVHIDMAELGAVGPATVLEVGDCPKIETGKGKVVVGKFEHSACEILNIHLDNGEIIGSTSNHRFWSEDRRDFVSADQLGRGERLRRADGTLIEVITVAAKSGTESVFNLEVQHEHTYGVTQAGVCVHNSNYTKRLSDPNPVPRAIRESYEEVRLGNGMPRLDGAGHQKTFHANELKRITGAKRNRWDGSLEYEVPGTRHRILERPDGVLGYVLEHDYQRPRVFPGPWYPDGV